MIRNKRNIAMNVVTNTLHQILSRTFTASAAIAAFALLSFGTTSRAEAVRDVGPDRIETVPQAYIEATKGVGIDQVLGAQIPLDLKMQDTSGRSVTLADYFNKGRPVILQLGYFRCPQVCDAVSGGLLEVAQKLNLELGKDYDMLFVSINPSETYDLALEKKRTYVQTFGVSGRGDATSGWNFLVGAESHTHKLAESVGFRFKRVAARQEFAHPTAVIILTPEGKVSRYLYGNRFSEQAVRVSLVEASSRKIGTFTDQFLSLCFHFDEFSGKNTPKWQFLMKVGGGLTILIVGFFLVRRWIHDARQPADAPLNSDARVQSS